MSRVIVADTRPTFQLTAKDQDGTAIDLTSASILLRYVIHAASGKTGPTEQAGSIDDAAAGIGSYQAADDELTAGDMEYEWQVTDGAGKVFIQDEPLHITVRDPVS